LTESNWENFFLCPDLNKSWQIFRDIFTHTLDKVAPVKEIKPKQRTEPWMTSEILDKIRQRDQLCHTFRKFRKAEDFKSFTRMRNLVQRMCRTAKADYFDNQIEENKCNPKKLWNQFKKLGYQHEVKSDSNIVLKIDGENCHDNNSIANHFNSYFTTVASKLVEKLPVAKGLYSVFSSLFENFYRQKSPSLCKLNLSHVSENFVYKELCSLNTSKSTGLDDIPARFLKDAAPVVKLPITFLINMSISEGKVPDDLKFAKVKPIFKKKDRLMPENYRPISILSIVSKILEKAVFIQLEQHLKRNNLMYEFQSGFRNSFSTDSCLIHLVDHVRTQTANGLYTGMVLLDLQKAFDTVDHSILCDKLSAIGVDSVPWFESYLTNRKQLVNVNGVCSDVQNVTCGVPQGSVLGPLLFLIYVNDLKISIDSECKVLIYADDTCILFSHNNPKVIAQKLSKMLESCHDWLVDNKLSLHLGKTESILFGSKRKLRNITESDFSISCYGDKIASTTNVKYLGITLDNLLHGEHIVSSIIKKANQRLKFLYRNNSALSLQSRKTLCVALIQCHFDYACSCWYEGLSKALKHKLQVTQNKVIRFILGLNNRHSLTFHEFHRLGFLNISNRVKQLRLNHVFNIFHDVSPGYLKQGFTRGSLKYITRSSHYNFRIPMIKGIESSTFFYSGVKDWNSLPNPIKETSNKTAFKKAVKQFLMDLSESDYKSDYVYY